MHSYTVYKNDLFGRLLTIDLQRDSGSLGPRYVGGLAQVQALITGLDVSDYQTVIAVDRVTGKVW